VCAAGGADERVQLGHDVAGEVHAGHTASRPPRRGGEDRRLALGSGRAVVVCMRYFLSS
jgi:hypothetical protein